MSIPSGVRPGTVSAGSKRSKAMQNEDLAGRSSRAPVRAGLFSCERGNALLEFAFVLPMMMAVITALYSFGITLNNQLALTQATGVGAQYLQTLRGNTTDPCADTLSAIEGAAPNLRASSINLTLTINGVTQSGSSCSGAGANLTQGGVVTVSTTYPCSLFIYGLNLGNSCQLSAQLTEYEY